MNNKEFLSAMAQRLNLTEKEVQKLTTSFVQEMAESLEDGDSLTVQGFGTFEVKKKLERVVVNPGTKQRMLVPPKLAIGFKPSPTLKGKFK